MEDKVVTISRAKGSLTFSANSQLLAAMNPCPCGYYGDSVKPCSCAPSTVTKYQKRISGPLLDRIDIHIEVPRVNFNLPVSRNTNIVSNADMRVAEIRQFCQLDDQSQGLMRSAMTYFICACLSPNLTARAHHRGSMRYNIPNKQIQNKEVEHMETSIPQPAKGMRFFTAYFSGLALSMFLACVGTLFF